MHNQLIYCRQYNSFIKAFAAEGIWGRKSHCVFDDNSVPMAVANEKDGVIASVIFHNYNPDAQTIEFSCYAKSKRWLSRRIINQILRYPFDELKLRIVFARFSEDNSFIGDIVKRLNATLHVLPELAAHNKDQIVAILKHENWKKSEIYTHERT